MNYAQDKTLGPAVALIVLCVISIILLLLALAFDVWLLASGAVDQLEDRGGIPKRTSVMMRTIWCILILVCNGVTMAGAVQMKSLQSPGFARLACILAVSPCVGPCCVLGVPVGIWGCVCLERPARVVWL